MKVSSQKKILGACLGHCVHVAGILNFLNLAGKLGYKTHFLGPAVSVKKLADAVDSLNPDIIAISYRLTPEVLEALLNSLKKEMSSRQWSPKKFIFGGTAPAAAVAAKSGLFEVVFSGQESLEEVSTFLQGQQKEQKGEEKPPQTLLERITFQSPWPLFRHHFGLPNLEETIKGVREIALSKSIDIISIGPDQNAQESFFRPKEMKKSQDGAGGVPLRKPDHLEKIYKASRCGNYPLLRCYSGTRDLIKWGQMLQKTINIAWGAVPLCWYNQLDGRSPRSLLVSIKENQLAMKWYADQDLPLEVNESHHWSLRQSPDSVAVAAAFLAAYNAKKVGVKHYIAQYMFNTPAGISPLMDLAKMKAKIELIESLHDGNFSTIRQTRTGLASLSSDPYVAKGQLAASSLFQLALKPKIIHVVGFCEGDHAATPSDIIESIRIVRGVAENYFLGSPQIADSSKLSERKEELIQEAKYLLQAILRISPTKVEDPWTDPPTIAKAVKLGLLDAPHLCGNPQAAGRVFTQIRNGACVAVDLHSGKTLKEKDRISQILK